MSQPKTIHRSSSNAESFNEYLTSVLVNQSQARAIGAKDLKTKPAENGSLQQDAIESRMRASVPVYMSKQIFETKDNFQAENR